MTQPPAVGPTTCCDRPSVHGVMPVYGRLLFMAARDNIGIGADVWLVMVSSAAPDNRTKKKQRPNA